jgi:hypothetical protein
MPLLIDQKSFLVAANFALTGSEGLLLRLVLQACDVCDRDCVFVLGFSWAVFVQKLLVCYHGLDLRGFVPSPFGGPHPFPKAPAVNRRRQVLTCRQTAFATECNVDGPARCLRWV